MAIASFSPSGFSYAQAAKGHAAARPARSLSNKTTPDIATSTNGTLSDSQPLSGSWADDVEASNETPAPTRGDKQAQSKSSQMDETKVEKSKPDSKAQTGSSGMSSPDSGTSSSVMAKDDAASSAPNGSASESTWETKSQASEPAWIAERKERQSTAQITEQSNRVEKKDQEHSAPPVAKPVVLAEAPPPTINPWLRRAEENKAKLASLQSAPKSPATRTAGETPALRENQRPQTDARKKASSIAGLPRDDMQSAMATAGVKKTASPQDSSPSDNVKADGQARASLPDLPTRPPPSVGDELSWPTPETALARDRKDSSEKDSPEKVVDEANGATKTRKKPEWQSMVVTPNIIFETQHIKSKEAPRTGERSGRGGMRGRGGLRGGPNGTNGGERSNGRTNPRNEDGLGLNTAQRGRPNTTDRDPALTASKAVRASSADSWSNPNWSSTKDLATKEESANERRTTSPGVSAQGGSEEAKQAQVHSSPDGRQARSPKATGSPQGEEKDGKRLPEPTARRQSASAGTQTDANQIAPSERPHFRMVASESRRESRGFDHATGKEPGFSSHPRIPGKPRGGRGRGGYRDAINGHHGSHAYSNGQATDQNGTSAFIAPLSPSAYQTRGSHQIPYTQTGRGGWSRGNPRSQSIPIDGFYNRFGHPYNAAQSQLPPVQTYIPGMYDFAGYPLTAVSYQPYLDHQYLMEMVSTQLEYYFSIDNLIKDMFLRKNMDSQGFVFLDVIANFNRIKQLTQDVDLLRAVCITSETLEIRIGEDGKERLRKREGWEQFLLPIDQRELAAQTDGPQQLRRPERPQTYGGMVARGPYATQPRLDRKSYDSNYGMANEYAHHGGGFAVVPEVASGDMPLDEGTRGRVVKSPSYENGTTLSPIEIASAVDMDTEPDTFPDEQAGVLTVVVKMNHQRVSYHSAASRTFSNGSIDSQSLVGEIGKHTAEGHSDSLTNGEALVNGSQQKYASRDASPKDATDRNTADSDISLFWMKDQSVPSEDLPTDVTFEPYTQLRFKALDQRNHAATGTCPYDMDVLYQFWCHFLIRNFNRRMYAEFKYFANDDAQSRHNLTGVQNLVKFYDQSLLSHGAIRTSLVRDYVELVSNEPVKLEGAAFKQLRAAWRNGALNLKNRKKLADMVDPVLKERLET